MELAFLSGPVNTGFAGLSLHDTDALIGIGGEVKGLGNKDIKLLGLQGAR